MMVGTVSAPLLGVTFEEVTEEQSALPDITFKPLSEAAATFGRWADLPPADNEVLASATHLVEFANVELLVWPDGTTTPRLTQQAESRLQDFAAVLSLTVGRFAGYAEIGVQAPTAAGPRRTRTF